MNPEPDQDAEHLAIAIVGMACLFPKAPDIETWWENLREGVDAITDVPSSHWRVSDYFSADPKAPDMTYASRGGFIDAVDFDPLFYGISPNNIEAIDSTQLLGMHVTRMALLDADYSSGKGVGDGRDFDRGRCSVVMGVTGTLELVIPLGARLGHPHWRRALAESGVDAATAEDVVRRIQASYVPWQENSFPGLLGNVVAGRVANRFDLGGTNCVVDAACASSLSALHMATMELRAGRCDMAISGGMDTFNDIFMYMCFSKTPALSPTGDSRPFSQHGDGTILGEGLGVVVLKRLEDARRDGDSIQAIIRGIGTSSDGRGDAVYTPSAEGQRHCLQDAYRVAAVAPDSIGLVEAHGTGTVVGDTIESAALIDTYANAQREAPWCALGSVKSMIGHTKAAAGMAGLIKCVLALRHRVLPPTLKAEDPLPRLQEPNAPFYLNLRKRPWIGAPDAPRRAAVSSFGFGGSNFHCILEEAKPSAALLHQEGHYLLFCFSADTPEKLRVSLDALTALDWSALRRSAAISRRDFVANASCRMAFVLPREASLDSILDEARALLSGSAESVARRRPRCWYSAEDKQSGLAFLFPGQGAQYTGMLRDLACQFPVFSDYLSLATVHIPTLPDIIWPFSGQDEKEADACLRDTRHAQPALAALSMAALQVLRHFGVVPNAVAGHSFGELVALYAAGCIDVGQCMKLAVQRGRIMAQAAAKGDGGMVAVFCTAAQAQDLLRTAAVDLSIVNYNAPEQVVVSGSTGSFPDFLDVCRSAGVRAVRLPVSGAFHSPQFADAVAPFAKSVQVIDFAPPELPVYANTTAAAYPQDPSAIQALLSGQLAAPVRFADMIQSFGSDIRCFVEVGPNQHLSGLLKKCFSGVEGVRILSLDSSRGKRHGVEDLAALLAQLAVLGHVATLAAWDAGFAPDSAIESGRMTIPVCGANAAPEQENIAVATLSPSLPAAQNDAETTISRSGLDRQSDKDAAMGQGRQDEATVVPSPCATSDQAKPLPSLAEQGILTLHRMQEDTAKLHRQYLELQEQAQQQVREWLLLQQRPSPGLQEAPPAVLQSGADVQPATIASPPVPPATADDRNAVVAANGESAGPSPVVAVAAPITPQMTTPSTHPEPAAPDGKGLDEILLSVVAEKTGYPREMLSLDMSLDTDLGIDSIKRVEILSAIQECLPEPVHVPPEELGTFKFLKHIVEYIASSVPTTAKATAADTKGDAATQEAMQAATRGSVTASSLSLLLSIVAEKTGYPQEMLEPEMRLDEDLGIDSIKRVEILSAVQERLPDLPPLSADVLGSLRTLQEVADHVAADTQAEHPEVPPASSPVETDLSPPIGSLSLHHDVERSVVETRALDAEPEAGDFGTDAVVRVISGESTLACQLLSALGEHCRDVVQLPFCAAADALKALSARVDLLILLQDTRPPIECLLPLFQSARRALRPGAAFCGVSFLGGRFGLGGLPSGQEAEQAALHGLIKTAAEEWSDIRCRVVDTEADIAVGRLCRELLGHGPLETGLCSNGRYTVQCRAAAVGNADGPPVQPGDRVVLSGGARGVTAELAWWMAREWQVELHLLGRTVLQDEPAWSLGIADGTDLQRAAADAVPGCAPMQLRTICAGILAQRQVQNTLQRLHDQGVLAYYHAVDVREATAVHLLFENLRTEYGPIHGMVHAAGVLSDRLIFDQTIEQFQNVYQTKVDGLTNLLTALGNDPVRFLAFFSSTTARFGRRGQGAYAAANEVLNKRAWQERTKRPDCRCVAFNWGPWEGGMVTPSLRQRFLDEGIGLIGLAAGARCLLQELCSQETSSELVFLATHPELEAGSSHADGSESDAELHFAFGLPLSVASCPVLSDHVLDQRAVLPVALMLEWLAHGALHNFPGMQFQGFSGFRVYNGVRLKHEDTVSLEIHAGSLQCIDGKEQVSVLMRSGETLHARGDMTLSGEFPQEGLQHTANLERPVGREIQDPYGTGRLFHGSALQSLQRIHSVGAQGVVAEVMSAPAPGQWMREPVRSNWLADPMILDGVFQALIIWSDHDAAMPCLPVSINHYRQYCRHFPKQGPILIVAHVKASWPNRLLADVECIDSKGQLLAVMSDCEAVRDTALQSAFTKNSLPVFALSP